MKHIISLTQQIQDKAKEKTIEITKVMIMDGVSTVYYFHLDLHIILYLVDSIIFDILVLY